MEMVTVPIDAVLGPTQLAVYGYIQNHPGCCGVEIATAFGLSKATIAYHTNRLEELELVVGERIPGRLKVALGVTGRSGMVRMEGN